MKVTGTTRLAAVIGSPVHHSLSPVIHNAAFEASGVDGVYVALPVDPGNAEQAVAAMRAFQWFGLSVTMPHKHDVLALCDVATDAAAELGAANCLFWRDGQVVGDNTDGSGFVRGLAADLSLDPAGLVCAVVGAGGAAKAVVRALGGAGASQVLVINRSSDKAEAAAALAGDRGAVGEPGDLGAADLVINATPLGMGSTPHADALPFGVDRLGSHAVVCDLIYHPVRTPLLAEAERRGLRTQNGLPMLTYQAVEQFERWTGVDAPVEAMAAALDKSLASRD